MALEEVGVVVGKLRFSDEIGVSGVGIGVLGEKGINYACRNSWRA